MSSEADYRLPRTVIPRRYDITLEPDLAAASFTGSVTIDVDVAETTNVVVLNAAELEITSAHLIGATGIEAVVDLDAERERATLTFPSPVEPGRHQLSLVFSGILNDQLRGFYRSTYTVDGEQKVMATTQFEATEARRAFPCWDEPDIKATFDVTLVVSAGLMAISNAPVVTDEPVAGGKRRVTFATTMKMSTYLVAFIVGELEATDPVDVEGVPLRIVHVPGKAHLTGFALEVGAFALRYFAEYYRIAYPGQKMDMIAVPDFAWGAMENLGAVTYRETALLVDPATATQAEQARVADVIAHELAHMWFGDLVTMKWWNGIWLNEAFATFMELKCVDAYRPDWKRWLAFASERNASMDIDALATTRPIEIAVGSPEEANAMFDILTYSKGASVLRMLEQYLGEETFQRGIARYLETHAYANTETHDLWAALETESGEPVGEIMHSWIFQGGHPRIDVSVDADTASLQQRPFRYEGSGDQQWMVPARYRSTDGTDRVLIPGDGASLPAAGGDVFLNEGGHGYYRTRYADDLRLRVAEQVPGMVDGERYTVVADTWAGVLAGDVDASAFLELVSRLTDETDPNVWSAVLTGLDELHRVVDAETRPNFEAFIAALLGPAFARTGWEPGAGESDLDRQLRGTLIASLGTIGGDVSVRNTAAEVVRRVDDGDVVDSEVASAALRVVAASGDLAVYDMLVEGFQIAASPQEEDRYLQAMTSVPEIEAVTRTLDMVVDGRIRSQNAGATVARLIGHRVVGADAWTRIRDRWDAVTERLPALTARTALTFVHLRSEPDIAADIRHWLTEHPLHGTETYISQQLERLGVRVALRTRASNLTIVEEQS